MSNINHVIFEIHSVISELEDQNDTWTDEREYPVVTNNKLGLTVNPFPLNPEDIIDLGGELVLDFEELVNS